MGSVDALFVLRWFLAICRPYPVVLVPVNFLVGVLEIRIDSHRDIFSYVV
jgi:hypothetical protein